MSIHNSDGYEKRGVSLLMEGNAEEALEVFEEGLRKFPGDLDLRLGSAMARNKLGDFVSACKTLEDLRKQRPAWGDVLQGLTEAYLARGRIKEAVLAATEASGGGEADAEFVHGLAFMFYSRKHYNEALPLYERAVALAPTWDSGHYGLGTCLWSLGRAEPAVASLTRAVELGPENWHARQYLGCVLYDLKRKKEAKAALDAVPLDAVWQKKALERLITMSWRTVDRKKRQALEKLRDRAVEKPQPDNAAKAMDEAERQMDQASAAKHPRAKGRFWIGYPTIVEDPACAAGFELDGLYRRIFNRDATFEGADIARAVRVDAQLLKRVIVNLAIFLEGFPWHCRFNLENEYRWPSGFLDGPDSTFEYSGANLLMFYAARVVSSAPRPLASRIHAPAEVIRLKRALRKLEDRVPVGSRAHRAWLEMVVAMNARWLIS